MKKIIDASPNPTSKLTPRHVTGEAGRVGPDGSAVPASSPIDWTVGVLRLSSGVAHGAEASQGVSVGVGPAATTGGVGVKAGPWPDCPNAGVHNARVGTAVRWAGFAGAAAWFDATPSKPSETRQALSNPSVFRL